MRLFLATSLLRLLAWVPLSVNRFFADALASLLYTLNIRERQTTERNLQLCFPEKEGSERSSLAARSMRESTRWAFETGAIWFRGAAWRNSVIKRTHNLELYQQALDKDAGLILIMPHFGNWELTGLWAGDQAKGTCIYRTPKMADLDPLVRKAREASELSTLVPANARGVMAVFKALKKGEQTMLLPDQVPATDGGLHSEFFGIPALTQTLLHNLIKKTQPTVLVAYAMRISGGFELGFLVPDQEIYSEDAQISVDALNRSIETLCKLDLAQYQWEYKRFKSQQNGSNLYAKNVVE